MRHETQGLAVEDLEGMFYKSKKEYEDEKPVGKGLKQLPTCLS
jgi:hypothetical protein